jgi:hypothetical protein
VSITHSLTLNWSSGTTTLLGTVTISTEVENNVSVSVPASTTNQQAALAFTVADVEMVYMISDVTVTLKTNSSGSPQETITLTAAKPVIWYTGCGLTIPFAGNVTTIYLTNATAGAAAVNIRILKQAS